jgi:hypothetical protein
MKTATKSQKLRIGILVFLIMILSINLFSRIYHNHPGEEFWVEDGFDTTTSNPLQIEGLVIQGAGYYLDSYAHVLSLLRNYENIGTSSLNLNDLKNPLLSAITSLEQAKSSFDRLVEIATKTPNKPEALDKLTGFDYDALMVEKSLNPYIFKEVKSLLIPGDITGAFKKSRANHDRISEIFKSILQSVNDGRLPEVRLLWQLNQEFSHDLLFGQYCAEVLLSIK